MSFLHKQRTSYSTYFLEQVKYLKNKPENRKAIDNFLRDLLPKMFLKPVKIPEKGVRINPPPSPNCRPHTRDKPFYNARKVSNDIPVLNFGSEPSNLFQEYS